METVITTEDFIAEWQRLVRHVAHAMGKTYSLSEADKEDLVSEINLKLLRVPEEKWGDIGYIRVTINNAARSGLDQIMCRGGNRKEWRDYSTMSYAAAINVAEEDVMDIDQIVPATHPDPEWEKKLALTKAIHRLGRDDRELLRLYLKELTAEQIGEQLEVSHTTVRTRLKKIIKKLKITVQK